MIDEDKEILEFDHPLGISDLISPIAAELKADLKKVTDLISELKSNTETIKKMAQEIDERNTID